MAVISPWRARKRDAGAAREGHSAHSRWATPSSEAVAGGQFVDDVDMDLADDLVSFRHVAEAVGDEPSDWSSENAIKDATRRYRTLSQNE
ncbi:hypothetical protein [Kibdelosporangium aridum]|uniref:Uncharacterized protein n=1 Tax=Kibdelosporangium aridum TaxID=2030 RepID=A0A1W2DGW0_KIBAR|nr:hypothetical protein [Kibdelosporangium aridum]SMC96743.1 hypothetical protein SAMN05661093_03351 [Kibdelosporangium aridum]